MSDPASVRDDVRDDGGSSADEARAALREGRAGVVWRRIVGDCITPVGAAARLIEAERGDFLLESVEGGSQRGRHSLLGLDPDLVFRSVRDMAQINRSWRSDRTAFEAVGSALPALRALTSECRFDVPAALPPALAVLVGYFGYETIGLIERVQRAEGDGLGLPDMLFVRPRVLLVFDGLTDDLHVVAPVWPDHRDPDQTVTVALDMIAEVVKALDTRAPLAPVSAPAPNAPELLLAPQTPAETYRSMVTRAKDYIVAGDIFQVVLSQRFTTPFALPPLALYRALRRVNPSPFLYHLDLPGFAIVGSSPEILVRVRDGEVTIRPIAGTRPRGASRAEDSANEASLLADPKERAEHLMLLDLGRNDIGRVSEAGSVTVTDSFTVERYSHVMHIVSNVVGRLAPGSDALDALFAGFPAGTVSGAPKIRACEIIAELEGDVRGPYAGGVGYFAPDGSVDSCIVLRTAVVKDGVMHVQAGAGIVADSDPDYEQRECEAKAGALLAAAREAMRLAGNSET